MNTSFQHRKIATLLFTLFATVGACGADTGGIGNTSEALVDGQADAPPIVKAARVPGVHDEVAGEPESDVATYKAGNSYVQWCDQSGPNGTVCRQQGCSGFDDCANREQVAREECWDEVVNDVCGAPTSPFYIVYARDGYWDRLN